MNNQEDHMNTLKSYIEAAETAKREREYIKDWIKTMTDGVNRLSSQRDHIMNDNRMLKSEIKDMREEITRLTAENKQYRHTLHLYETTVQQAQSQLLDSTREISTAMRSSVPDEYLHSGFNSTSYLSTPHVLPTADVAVSNEPAATEEADADAKVNNLLDFAKLFQPVTQMPSASDKPAASEPSAQKEKINDFSLDMSTFEENLMRNLRMDNLDKDVA